MDAPAPRSPYARLCGIVSSHLGADWHQGQSLNPACDNAVNREFSRFAACNRAVEHGTVDQFTGVVHANVVSACRDSAVALVDHAELQARLRCCSRLHAHGSLPDISRLLPPSLRSARDAQRQHVRGFHAAHGAQHSTGTAGCLPSSGVSDTRHQRFW
ncbi:Uncharacterised protein [Enterobacter cloacae]|uniref:Uncharacterized protein n=1 Tax=Enterobacter cloacae TaxID=550 RepID=A0A377M787_ENTCL|nr:Uncharacterised protein [Enterobacter cloacae]